MRSPEHIVSLLPEYCSNTQCGAPIVEVWTRGTHDRDYRVGRGCSQCCAELRAEVEAKRQAAEMTADAALCSCAGFVA